MPADRRIYLCGTDAYLFWSLSETKRPFAICLKTESQNYFCKAEIIRTFCAVIQYEYFS